MVWCIGAGVLVLALLMAPVARFSSAAERSEDEISATHEKDKTVYTIGGATQKNNDPDRELAWDPLKDIQIEMRETDGKRSNTGRR